MTPWAGGQHRCTGKAGWSELRRRNKPGSSGGPPGQPSLSQLSPHHSHIVLQVPGASSTFALHGTTVNLISTHLSQPYPQSTHLYQFSQMACLWNFLSSTVTVSEEHCLRSCTVRASEETGEIINTFPLWTLTWKDLIAKSRLCVYVCRYVRTQVPSPGVPSWVSLKSPQTGGKGDPIGALSEAGQVKMTWLEQDSS